MKYEASNVKISYGAVMQVMIKAKINDTFHIVNKNSPKPYLITNTYSSKTFNFRIYAKIYQICICGGGIQNTKGKLNCDKIK